LKNVLYTEAFEKLWLEEAETKSRLPNRLFCITFLICNPASSIPFYLAGDPFFQYSVPYPFDIRRFYYCAADPEFQKDDYRSADEFLHLRNPDLFLRLSAFASTRILRAIVPQPYAGGHFRGIGSQVAASVCTRLSPALV
jgi:hypothetical protein